MQQINSTLAALRHIVGSANDLARAILSCSVCTLRKARKEWQNELQTRRYRGRLISLFALRHTSRSVAERSGDRETEQGGNPPGKCSCSQDRTSQHVLLTCTNFREARNNMLPLARPGIEFDGTQTVHIITFLRRVGLGFTQTLRMVLPTTRQKMILMLERLPA